MHEFHLLTDIIFILGSALGVAWVFSRLNLPTIAGFLAAGIALGPGALGVVSNEGEIAIVAEIGVILLLFTIGLELSLKEVRRLAAFVFGAGSLQMGVTTAVVAGISWALGYAIPTAIFFGCLAALSSTAIVLTSLRESDELASVHGRGMVGILLFQDLAVVPLILLVPFLSGEASGLGPALVTLGKAGGMIVAVWLVASYVFPWIAERVVRTRRRELFTLYTVLVAVGTAAASGAAGLSLALGAFLAGLVISESPYSEQMTAEVEPFKDVFNSLFFVSMGLLVDPGLFIERPLTILGLFGAVLLIKALITGIVTGLLGHGVRIAILVGLGLSQVGEFSFILASEGIAAGLLTDTQYGLFLATAVLTMVVTPFFLKSSGAIAARLPDFGGTGSLESDESEEELDDHVIIVGYGTTGRNLAQSLDRLETAHTIVDMNPNTVADHRADKSIHYGDATREPILRELGIDRAHSLIVTIADRDACRRIISAARRLNPDIFLVARARFVNDVRPLRRAGADQVVVEEFETSLELVAKTLEGYDVSPGKVLREKDYLRVESAGDIERSPLPDEPRARHTLRYISSAFHTEFIRIPRRGESSGRTIQELALRQQTGATIVAVARDGELFAHPEADFELQEWDQVLLVGEPAEIKEAGRLLSAGAAEK
jgi:CPA2 family monovalent cation:H+ antiporter-2